MARHRVQVLRAGGKTLRRIAAETGISLRSVRVSAHRDHPDRSIVISRIGPS